MPHALQMQMQQQQIAAMQAQYAQHQQQQMQMQQQQQAAAQKRKESPGNEANGRDTRDSSQGREASGSSGSGSAAAAAAAAAAKRIKTARACDSCRRKKIRCDVIEDGSPVTGDPNNGNGGLTCAHCRQYGFGECSRRCAEAPGSSRLAECTFFLPITETRFKKKHEREREEAAQMAAAHALAQSRAGLGGGMYPSAGAPRLPVPGMPGSLPPLSGIAGRYAGYGVTSGLSRLDSQGPLKILATQEWPPRSGSDYAGSGPPAGFASSSSPRASIKAP